MKLECANHTCKCYRSGLEKLLQNKPSYKKKGGLTQKIRNKLVSAARSAITMRSTELDCSKAITALKKKLVNGPQLCFGYHDKCSRGFCTAAKERTLQNTMDTSDNEKCNGDDIDGK
jgi:hypothetical protein